MRMARAAIVGAALASLVMAGPAPALPGGKALTGRVAAVQDDVLLVRTKPGTTIEVKLVGTTRYLKWVTTKPLQRDTRADRSLLAVGKLVAVETQSGEAPLEARVVRIAVD